MHKDKEKDLNVSTTCYFAKCPRHALSRVHELLTSGTSFASNYICTEFTLCNNCSDQNMCLQLDAQSKMKKGLNVSTT